MRTLVGSCSRPGDSCWYVEYVGPMGGGQRCHHHPPLYGTVGMLAPLRDIIDSEWWKCSTVRKAHRRARVVAERMRPTPNHAARRKRGTCDKFAPDGDRLPACTPRCPPSNYFHGPRSLLFSLASLQTLPSLWLLLFFLEEQFYFAIRKLDFDFNRD